MPNEMKLEVNGQTLTMDFEMYQKEQEYMKQKEAELWEWWTNGQGAIACFGVEGAKRVLEAQDKRDRDARGKKLNKQNMGTKTLDVVNNIDLKVVGHDLWQVLCKASSESQGWMKSTKAMQIDSIGVIVQVTTQQRNIDGTYSIAEALTYVPGVEVFTQEQDGAKWLQFTGPTIDDLILKSEILKKKAERYGIKLDNVL